MRKIRPIIVTVQLLYIFCSNLIQANEIPVTALSYEEAEVLLKSIPNVGENPTCLTSETCANDWIKTYNFVYERVISTSSVLGVEKFFL